MAMHIGQTHTLYTWRDRYTTSRHGYYFKELMHANCSSLLDIQTYYFIVYMFRAYSVYTVAFLQRSNERQ